MSNTEDTKREAHRSKSKSAEQKIMIMKFLGRCRESGATDEEMQIALEMPGNVQRPRRGELVDAGAIRADGKRATRSGRDAVVWKIAPPPTDRSGQMMFWDLSGRFRAEDH